MAHLVCFPDRTQAAGSSSRTFNPPSDLVGVLRAHLATSICGCQEDWVQVPDEKKVGWWD